MKIKLFALIAFAVYANMLFPMKKEEAGNLWFIDNRQRNESIYQAFLKKATDWKSLTTVEKIEFIKEGIQVGIIDDAGEDDLNRNIKPLKTAVLVKDFKLAKLILRKGNGNPKNSYGDDGDKTPYIIAQELKVYAGDESERNKMEAIEKLLLDNM